MSKKSGSESIHADAATGVLKEFRTALAATDLERASAVRPSVRNIDPEEFPESCKILLSHYPNPDRDRIIQCEASDSRIVTVWRVEPDHPEMIYLIPLHFRKYGASWIIEFKGNRWGMGLKTQNVADMLRIGQAVLPEQYTLTGA